MPKHDPFSPDSAIKVGESKSEAPAKAPAPEKPGASASSAPTAEATKSETKTEGTEPVPHGTVKEILAWVGDDEDKALAAYDAELASDEPRSSLIDALEEKLA